MKKKAKTIKKKNVADATLRNVRAQNKRLAKLEAKFKKLALQVANFIELDTAILAAAKPKKITTEDLKIFDEERAQLEEKNAQYLARLDEISFSDGTSDAVLDNGKFPRHWGVSVPLTEIKTTTVEDKQNLILDGMLKTYASAKAICAAVNSEKKKTAKSKKKNKK